jgi:hypothetical protein
MLSREISEIGMPEPCFIKKDSAPPVCGIHDVRLIKKLIPDELIASLHKEITYLVCPVSRSAINDEKK